MSILAKLFPGNVEAEKLEAEVAENATLRESLATAQAKIDELQNLAGEIAAKDLKITDLTAKVDEFSAKLTEKDLAIADLTEKATLTAEKISIEASRQLAATGHPAPVATTEESNQISIIDQFSAIEDPSEKLKFYRQNKAALLAAQSKK
jgi:hypothetical protein